MKKLMFIATYRLLFAILGLAAVITQFANSTNLLGDAFHPDNFFSFFTIESNLLFIGVLFVGSYMAWKRKTSQTFEIFRGAAMIYMLITGIIFSLFLTGLEEELLTHVPWVNSTLHYVLPVIAVLDWIVDVPKKQIPFKKGLVWLIFPVAYLVYTLVRGNYTAWYPYPFLNPTLEGGWNRVISMAIFITFVFVFVVWLTTRSTSFQKLPKKAKH